MSELRIPGYSLGAAIGGEPQSWLIIDRETGERRLEMNPNYVSPPPPTERELAEWAVRDAENAVAQAREDLAYARAELDALDGRGMRRSV